MVKQCTRFAVATGFVLLLLTPACKELTSNTSLLANTRLLSTSSYPQAGEWSYDYTTIKYDSTGQQVWLSQYNSPNNNQDVAQAMSVDQSGNVYVTGRSLTEFSSYDIATVKYDAHGTQLWSATYSGPGYAHDEPVSLAVDRQGNVYVAGYSFFSDPYAAPDYITIKYDDRGDEVWAVHYRWPGDSACWPTQIAVDASGNIYVIGTGSNEDTVWDYVTVKYDINGKKLWAARYDRQAGNPQFDFKMALDKWGNVYLAGSVIMADGFSSIVAIKYDTNGKKVWEADYKGSGQHDNSADAIGIDAAGNVVVSGIIGNDRNGPLPGNDFETVKYDTRGQLLWAATWDGPGGSDDRVKSLAVDAEGNIYVAGTSTKSNSDYFSIVKYGPGGSVLWAKSYGDPGSGNEAVAVVVDGRGEAIVGGWINTNGTLSYAVVKYTKDGSELWSANYRNTRGGNASLSAVAVDSEGSVVITGYAYGPYGMPFTIRSPWPEIPQVLSGLELNLKQGDEFVTKFAFNMRQSISWQEEANPGVIALQAGITEVDQIQPAQRAVWYLFKAVKRGDTRLVFTLNNNGFPVVVTSQGTPSATNQGIQYTYILHVG